ncbi:cytidine/deoxycytidylate deaminase family protein [Desulforamulus putei]|uniref:deoxycytidylate deaminase n=1 Tax=Desulforamulus putei TaxID=74701 RepID=UPI002FDECA81
MRPSWDEYFMEITRVVATRSTCLRRKVGAIIVKDNRILTTGYNGPPSGLSHCEVVGCIRDKYKIPSGERHEFCRGLHAEQNALIQAAVHGIAVEGGTIYVTHQPCVMCTKMIVNAKLEKVVIGGDYPDELARSIFEEAGIKLVRFK